MAEAPIVSASLEVRRTNVARDPEISPLKGMTATSPFRILTRAASKPSGARRTSDTQNNNNRFMGLEAFLGCVSFASLSLRNERKILARGRDTDTNHRTNCRRERHRRGDWIVLSAAPSRKQFQSALSLSS